MALTLARLVAGGVRTFAALADLVLPVDCAACGSVNSGPAGACVACRAVLATPPTRTRPTPAPPVLPPCYAVAEYDGELRELILAYKERSRRGLAAPLGAALAAAVAAGAGVASVPLAVVPVPCTGAAIRARQGDHMLRLARAAARQLRRTGLDVVLAAPLRALPKQDSAHLDRHARTRAAMTAFAARPSRLAPLRALADTGAVVVVDDVLTTGATLAAVSQRLLDEGVPVAFAATLAATRLRRASHSPPIMASGS